RLFASVPPEVKTTSPLLAPVARAISPRALSTASAARCPRRCREEGFPNSSSRYGRIAARTPGSSGVVEALSRQRRGAATAGSLRETGYPSRPRLLRAAHFQRLELEVGRLPGADHGVLLHGGGSGAEGQHVLAGGKSVHGERAVGEARFGRPDPA